MAESACPRAAQFFGREITARNNFQRCHKFRAKIIAAARRCAGECRERLRKIITPCDTAVITLHTPDSRHNMMIDAELFFCRAQRCRVFFQHRTAIGDFLGIDQRGEIIPNGCHKFGLGFGEFDNFGIGLNTAHDAIKQRGGHALRFCLRAQFRNA